MESNDRIATSSPPLMRISTALRVLGAASFAAMAACSSDLPSAPMAASVAEVEAPSFAKGGAATSVVDRTVVIAVDTRVSRSYSIGGQSWVYIPAGAICTDDSGYGPELWDTPCERATGIIEIPVSVRSEAGRPVAEFHKDVRFAPAAHWSGWVILGLKIQGNLNRNLGYGILYRPTGSRTWIDESQDDRTLTAWRAPGNVIARRLKHFSGYNVSLGFDEQQDPSNGLVGGAF